MQINVLGLKLQAGNSTFWAFFALCAFVFLAPNVDFAPALSWHDGQRLAQLALLGMVVLSLTFTGAGSRAVRIWAELPWWSRGSIVGAFGLGLISAFCAPLVRWSMLEWGLLVLLVATAFYVAAMRQQLASKFDRLLVVTFFATALAYTVKAATVYVATFAVGGQYGLGFDMRDLYTGFSNIRFFGHMQTMLLPFLLLPAIWWGNTWPKRALLCGVPALWWMLALGAGTRGTWVALLAGMAVTGVLRGQSGRLWLKWQFAGLLSGMLCYAVLIWLIPGLIDPAMSPTLLTSNDDLFGLSKREVLWWAVVDFSVQNPWLGIGPMHFSFYPNTVAAHPHNAILQFMSEWGLPATFLLVAAFAAAGIAFARLVRRNTDRWTIAESLVATALFAAIVGAAVQAMVDGVIVMPVSQMLLVILCGWAMAMYFPASAKTVSDNVRLSWGICILLFAASAVVWGVLPEITVIEQREAAYLQTQPQGTRLLPRFWAQGWIGN